ncbi:hypothetical protein QYF36_003701 [Acer negundo]|nr:hypothetical protein QYF36_003701 [Acer negundo]
MKEKISVSISDQNTHIDQHPSSTALLIAAITRLFSVPDAVSLDRRVISSSLPLASSPVEGFSVVVRFLLPSFACSQSPTLLALTDESSRPAFRQLLVRSKVFPPSFASRHHRSRFHVGFSQSQI